jgi:hypothetical protein
LLWRAERAGAQIGAFCNLLYNRQGEVDVRRILGVLALAKRYGLSAVEDTCAAALEMGVASGLFGVPCLGGPKDTGATQDYLSRKQWRVT